MVRHYSSKIMCVCILLVCFGVMGDVIAKTYSFEPALSEVCGTAKLETFPGPPNYEDISKGDHPESHWMLTPSIPINIKSCDDPKAQSTCSAANDVKKIQLIFDATSQANNFKFFNKDLDDPQLCVDGYLYRGITGHYYADIALRVTDFYVNDGGDVL